MKRKGTIEKNFKWYLNRIIATHDANVHHPPEKLKKILLQLTNLLTHFLVDSE